MEHSRPRQQLGLLALVGAGTLVRLVYAWALRPWTGAPDQLAWGLLIQDARQHGVRWDQIAHWPHEGASILLGAPAVLLPESWLGLPALSWTALVVDTVSRAVQVLVVVRLFGSRAGWWYAIWLVCAVPGLVPWGTVNFGLHGLSAFWPFVLLYTTVRFTGAPTGWTLGLVLGLALSWSYDAVPFVLVALVAGVLRAPAGRGRWLVTATGALVMTLVPHGLIRMTLDYGFALEAYSLFAVRDVSPSMPGPWVVLVRAVQTVFESVPGATLLPSLGFAGSDVALRWGWTGLCGVGLLGAATLRTVPANANANANANAAVLACAGVATYLLIYAASPFHVAVLRATDAVTYRHLAFVLPIMTALALVGSWRWSWGRFVPPALVVIGVLGTGQVITTGTRVESDWAGAGWILARKLGHDPGRVERVVRFAPPGARGALLEGVGWGLTAVLLEDVVDPRDPRVDRLVELVARFDARTRPAIHRGMRRAFHPDVTPALTGRLRVSVTERLTATRPDGAEPRE